LEQARDFSEVRVQVFVRVRETGKAISGEIVKNESRQFA
jgi:hypothetical protein